MDVAILNYSTNEVDVYSGIPESVDNPLDFLATLGFKYEENMSYFMCHEEIKINKYKITRVPTSLGS